MITNEEIAEKLKAAMPLDDVHVSTDDGSHFQVIAVSDIFEIMSRVKKQQAIYAPLSEYIADNRIHALSIKTYTAKEWQRERKLVGL